MATCSYNCNDLSGHEKATCGAFRKGGITAGAIIECDADIADYTSAAEWEAAIAAGTVKLFTGIKANVPDAAPIEGENPEGCGSATIVDGFDNTFVVRDFNVNSTNDEFYKALNARSFYLAWFYCQEDEIRVVDYSAVTVVALPASSPESNKEKQLYNATFKWSSGVSEAPVLYDAPTGIFD